MRIVNCAQYSEEWFDSRLGLVTASEADSLITPKWKIKDLDDAGPRTYLFRKIAETWLCAPVDQFSSFQTEQGSLLEPEAVPWFEAIRDCDVDRVGFIIADDKRSGCSPDGIIKDQNCGLELKCPQPTNAVRYAMDGILPPDYELQVHFSMFVTGFQKWNFMSYHRKLPKLIVEVERDEEKITIIEKALKAFYAKFDEAWDKLNAIADEPRVNPFLRARGIEVEVTE